MTKPEIPKRLASRIRAAQAKVTDARDDIIYGEQAVKEREARIAEFEDDPEAFAAKYYRGQGVDSYPVQTMISRTRESLARRMAKRHESVPALCDAEENLVNVEREVLAEVTAMKPSAGRVPWPRKLRSFEKHKLGREIEDERERRRFEADQEKRRREDEIEDARQDAEDTRRSAISDAEYVADMRADYAALSPQQRAAEEAKSRQIAADLKAGRITMADITGAIRRS